MKTAQQEITVLKFGSSVLRTPADLPSAVHEIYRWYRSGERVVAVVSAIGDTTNALLAHANSLSPQADSWATAELLATGERTSAALLAVALARAGVASRIVDPREVGFVAGGNASANALDAEPLAIDTERLRGLINDFPVIVVPGFFAVGACGRTRLLGRGGSDLTAVFLACSLNANRCRLIKDVDGVYDVDPAAKSASAQAHRFRVLRYADALNVAARLIQPKAITYLEQRGAQTEIAAPARAHVSIVHGGPSETAETVSAPTLNVLLLGLGTVGFGIYERLLASPESFRVVGALIRQREKYEALGVSRAILYTDASYVRVAKPDLVIDALPGVEPSGELIEHFLSEGIPVISANKAAIAQHGVELAAIAARTGATLRYSAAVGGSAPMIEAVRRMVERGGVEGIAAVLNGTCNYVLDRCAAGLPFAEAIAAAQHEGFAEQDPSEDLSGRDSTRKLWLLARCAFGEEPKQMYCQVLDEAVCESARSATQQGLRIRQVARVSRQGTRIVGVVQFEEFGVDSVFGRLEREWNALEVTGACGTVACVTGRGAGRWPTTEAVIGDLWDVWRETSR